MNLSGSQRYNFDELRENISNALLNDKMPDNLYKSVDGISRIINSIFTTKGGNWAAQVLDDNGKPLLTSEEQTKFRDVFNPYIDSIKKFFNGDKRDDDNEVADGAATDSAATEGTTVGGAVGIDDVYTKIIDRIKNVDNTVNDYASKYGVLKLEKEYDLKDDFSLPIPTPITLPPPFTPVGLVLSFLAKNIKIPFRTIVTTIYLILDITRIAISSSSSGSNTGRKILSILVALLELLRGDWKKAILTCMGFYGMSPMLTGQLLKVFLTVFRMLSPDIQNNIIFAPLNISKSLITGILLSIFQIAAPNTIREPLIKILNEIAKKKADLNTQLAGVGVSERPDYLSPNWNDLNNIQAVLSDEKYICSCQGRELIKEVSKSTIIKIILQLLRIPVTDEMITLKCGNGACKDFSTLMATDGSTSGTVPETVPALVPAPQRVVTQRRELSGGNPLGKRTVRRKGS